VGCSTSTISTTALDTVFISEARHNALEMVSRRGNRISPDGWRGNVAGSEDAGKWVERTDAADKARSFSRDASQESVDADRRRPQN
jgi:hypothetical protein